MPPYTNAKNKTTLRGKRRQAAGWLVGSMCRIALLLVVLGFGVLYVVKINAISAKGYDLAALERQREELTREKDRLAFEIAKHQSIGSIQARLPELHLVSVDTIEYLNVGAAVVARR